MSSEETLFEAEAGMEKAIDFMMHEFAAIRTGKASPALVEKLRQRQSAEPAKHRIAAAEKRLAQAVNLRRRPQRLHGTD